MWLLFLSFSLPLFRCFPDIQQIMWSWCNYFFPYTHRHRFDVHELIKIEVHGDEHEFNGIYLNKLVLLHRYYWFDYIVDWTVRQWTGFDHVLQVSRSALFPRHPQFLSSIPDILVFANQRTILFSIWLSAILAYFWATIPCTQLPCFGKVGPLGSWVRLAE